MDKLIPIKLTPETRQKGGYILVIISTFALLLATGVIHALAVFDRGQFDIFQYTTDELWYYYDADIVPSQWVFAMYAVAYAGQLVWLMYGLSTLCRLSGNKDDDACLYCDPGHMPISMYVSYMVGLGGFIAWFFVWDRMYDQYSLLCILIAALSIDVSLGISLQALEKATPKLEEKNMKSEIYLVGILVQNGIGLFSEILNGLALVSLAIVLTNHAGVDAVTSGTIVLGIYTFLTLLYFALDMFVIRNKTRYLLLPYFVQLVFIAGILEPKIADQNQNFLFAIVLLAVLILIILAKIVIIIVMGLRSSNEDILLAEVASEKDAPMPVSMVPVQNNMSYVPMSAVQMQNNIPQTAVTMQNDIPMALVPSQMPNEGTRVYNSNPVLQNDNQMTYVLKNGMQVQNPNSNYMIQGQNLNSGAMVPTQDYNSDAMVGKKVILVNTEADHMMTPIQNRKQLLNGGSIMQNEGSVPPAVTYMPSQNIDSTQLNLRRSNSTGSVKSILKRTDSGGRNSFRNVVHQAMAMDSNQDVIQPATVRVKTPQSVTEPIRVMNSYTPQSVVDPMMMTNANCASSYAGSIRARGFSEPMPITAAGNVQRLIRPIHANGNMIQIPQVTETRNVTPVIIQKKPQPKTQIQIIRVPPKKQPVTYVIMGNQTKQTFPQTQNPMTSDARIGTQNLPTQRIATTSATGNPTGETSMYVPEYDLGDGADVGHQNYNHKTPMADKNTLKITEITSDHPPDVDTLKRQMYNSSGSQNITRRSQKGNNHFIADHWVSNNDYTDTPEQHDGIPGFTNFI